MEVRSGPSRASSLPPSLPSYPPPFLPSYLHTFLPFGIRLFGLWQDARGHREPLPLQEPHYLDPHRPEQPRLADLGLGAVDQLAEGAHHLVGLPGLEELHCIERALPVGEEPGELVGLGRAAPLPAGGFSFCRSPPRAIIDS